MNERQIIEMILEIAGGDQNQAILKNIGDDCAVVRKNETQVWLLTIDTLVESIHFDRAFHPAEKLGHKVVSVNVSDIAAMGGRPFFLLLSIALPRHFDPEWLRAFTRGLGAACREYGCFLIGGDTVASPEGFSFTVTAIGEAENGKVLYRRGALPGDQVWVSGMLGLAAAGLTLLTTGIGAEDQSLDLFREKHLMPRARVELARQLADCGCVHAMMDLSDGLATDLAHLCDQSHVGAQIFAETLPGLDLLDGVARRLHADALSWSLCGGEDYELLFTAADTDSGRLLRIAAQCGVNLVPVGRIVEGTGVTLIRKLADGGCETLPMTYQGYDHFRSSHGTNSMKDHE